MSMVGTITIEKREFPHLGEVLIYPVFSDTLKNDKNLQLLDQNTNGLLFTKIKDQDFNGKQDELISIELSSFFKHIILVGLGKEKNFTVILLRNAVAQALLFSQKLRHASTTLFYDSRFGNDVESIGTQLSLAFFLTNYSYDVFKNEEYRKKVHKIKLFELCVTDFSEDQKTRLVTGISLGKTFSSGIALARNLVNLPGSHLAPETLVNEAREIEKNSKNTISVQVLEEDECKKLGMGAFLGVAQGSDKKPKFIILHYKGNKNSKICLIGKSITFDSGGLSLKPAGSMETMKCDMAGGATVLGVFSTLHSFDKNELGEIWGILPACENMPSGKAIRPGDIVTTMDKQTIEVLNTDAEGRLTLADAIAYAEAHLKPDVIIDLATLTGACMVALGMDIAGMFGNNELLNKKFKQIAKDVGDELWELPLYKSYAKQMKSDIADLKNVSSGRWGGTITAALFLEEFVKKSKWIHLDIAGPAYEEKGQHGIITKGGTGWGIMSLITFIRSY